MNLKGWVLNASPIIVLSKSGVLNLIGKLSDQWIIPQGVISEVSQKSDFDLIKKDLSEHSRVVMKKVTKIDPYVLAWDLGKGESEVLSLGMAESDSSSYGLVLDDLQARKCAHLMSIPLIGSLGLVLKAKRKGLIEFVKPVFLKLQTSGLYISPTIVSDLLRSVGE
jgi:predicted nucleic acid-binding protein